MKNPNETLAKSFDTEGSSPGRVTGSWKRFTLLDRLVEDLSSPEAYLHDVDEVTVIKTPMSVVFLAGEWVYKVKKPVSLPFVDFSTLEQRVSACHEEIKLNRRTTRRVYSGVTPIIFRDGRHRVAGAGSPVEYAVCMRRLPHENNLRQMLQQGTLEPSLLHRLAARVAAFHKDAERGRRISAQAHFVAVKASITDCFWQTAETVGTVVSTHVHQRLEALMTAQMRANAKLIEARALRGVPCDTHGDLRLGHVYLDTTQRAPHDLALIDCVEYDERQRAADPVVDVACLCMDLARLGRPDLAQTLAEAFFEASGDDEGRALLPLYMAHRALTRAKVDTIRTRRVHPDDEGDEAAEAERQALIADARGLWLAALGILETPRKRPCLVVACGAPIQRFHVAHGLEAMGFRRIELDSDFIDGLRSAEAVLYEGDRVVVEGLLLNRSEREELSLYADRWGVRRHFFACPDEDGEMPTGWEALEGPTAQFSRLLPPDPTEAQEEARRLLIEAELLD